MTNFPRKVKQRDKETAFVTQLSKLVNASYTSAMLLHCIAGRDKEQHGKKPKNKKPPLSAQDKKRRAMHHDAGGSAVPVAGPQNHNQQEAGLEDVSGSMKMATNNDPASMNHARRGPSASTDPNIIRVKGASQRGGNGKNGNSSNKGKGGRGSSSSSNINHEEVDTISSVDSVKSRQLELEEEIAKEEAELNANMQLCKSIYRCTTYTLHAQLYFPGGTMELELVMRQSGLD